MFEHLDDPSPPGPTPRTLGMVLERSSRMRRRRAASATSAVGVMALACGVLIGVVAARSPAPVPADFSAKVGVAVGTAVPVSALNDVVFVSESKGFGLAVHSAQTALVSSDDGGDTWQVVQGNLPIQYPAQILFADADDGYLWGGAPSSDGSLPLWATSDGGRDWTQAPIGPVVSDVSAIGESVWAVVGSCFVGVTSSPGSCTVSTEMSDDNGATWTPTVMAPPISESNALSVSDQDVELARMSLLHAYVLSFEPGDTGTGAGQGASTGQLVYTVDGGHSWQSRVDPCPSYLQSGEEIAGSSSRDLWVMCASQASAGSQAKALYRSYDGGFVWSLASDANAPVLSGNIVLPARGGLPVSGYVEPYSLGHENLAVLSPTSAWIFPDRAAVLQTTDGGSSWSAVSALERAGLESGGTGNIVFVNATHGWVCELGVGLWRTTDGTSWQRIGP